ncbi:MAG: LysM peptidoglycan-binding domain-containing protein, partial [Mesorhizobium sp.]
PPPSAPAAAKPMRTASAPALAPAPAAPHLDRTATNTVAPAAKPFKTAEPDAVRNASAAPHATEIVVREGETISGLARQYHVPADAIIKVNGLDANKGIRTGQKIVIPAYAYSSKGGPKVADSTKPANTPKQPAGAPEKVAVLPQQPKLKDGKSAAQVDASA